MNKLEQLKLLLEVIKLANANICSSENSFTCFRLCKNVDDVIRDRMGPERRSGSFFKDRNGVKRCYLLLFNRVI